MRQTVERVGDDLVVLEFSASGNAGIDSFRTESFARAFKGPAAGCGAGELADIGEYPAFEDAEEHGSRFVVAGAHQRPEAPVKCGRQLWSCAEVAPEFDCTMEHRQGACIVAGDAQEAASEGYDTARRC
jgi:hypothetical protein